MEGEILEDLSNPHSDHQVYLYEGKPHGKLVKKQYGSLSAFKRSVEAFKFIDRSLHSAIYKIDSKHSTLYMSYDPMEKEPRSMDRTVAKLLKELHTSTKKYSGVWDPGTGDRYASWKALLQKKGGEAVQALQPLNDFSGVFEKWIAEIEESVFSPVSYLHGSPRPEHVGQRKGNYLLLNLDHAILGDPYWDVALYAAEFAESKEDFYAEYGLEDRKKAEAFTHLAALDRAAYLFQHQLTETTSFERCLNLLKED